MSKGEMPNLSSLLGLVGYRWFYSHHYRCGNFCSVIVRRVLSPVVPAESVKSQRQRRLGMSQLQHAAWSAQNWNSVGERVREWVSERVSE